MVIKLVVSDHSWTTWPAPLWFIYQSEYRTGAPTWGSKLINQLELVVGFDVIKFNN